MITPCPTPTFCRRRGEDKREEYEMETTKPKRARRVVALSKVQEVLKRIGKGELLEEILSSARRSAKAREFKLKRRETREIEKRLARDGVVVIKARKDNKGVLLFGKANVRWHFKFSRDAEARGGELIHEDPIPPVQS
jgi:hypothetical protein